MHLLYRLHFPYPLSITDSINSNYFHIIDRKIKTGQELINNFHCTVRKIFHSLDE